MKLAVRVFAFAIALTGFAAASVTSNPTPQSFRSHQSAADSIPIPMCGPGMGCSATGK